MHNRCIQARCCGVRGLLRRGASAREDERALMRTYLEMWVRSGGVAAELLE